jgi:uncharacterized protein (UPF0332 family)
MSKEKVDTPQEGETEEKTQTQFEQELSRLHEQSQQLLRTKKSSCDPLMQAINEHADERSMGFYLVPDYELSNNVPYPNFEKLTLYFLLDDFERPVQQFDPRILLGERFEEFLETEEKKDAQQQTYHEYVLKEDKSIRFVGMSISMLRENCFDGFYDDLKQMGGGIIIEDYRGFISALKTIDIHRNMLLQKFEKYVVVYAGAGSWLRGEKSNDFDVFVVIDDTDVKRMSRLQVKDQLTKIIWQMSREVAAVTGIQIHIQVYLLTDFWEALKDAHPVMFTFLRDGVPFYDRGLYSAWKELLKLGKIRPSPEAIDMHMNAGSQLLDRAKKMFLDIAMNDIYHAVLNPSQAILMLKGYNPTTPKETVRMFRDVLLEKEETLTEEDVKTLEENVQLFKDIEHNKDLKLKGEDLDRMIENAEEYLKKIKNLFEEISEQRTKDSIVSSYNELIHQIRSLPGMGEVEDERVIEVFEEEYVKKGEMPGFVKESLNDIKQAKEDYDEGKSSTTEVNKVLKEIRNVLAEVKEHRDKSLLNEANRKKLTFYYDDSHMAELLAYDDSVYLFDLARNKTYELGNEGFTEVQVKKESLLDNSRLKSLRLDEHLMASLKKILGVDSISL